MKSRFTLWLVASLLLACAASAVSFPGFDFSGTWHSPVNDGTSFQIELRQTINHLEGYHSSTLREEDHADVAEPDRWAPSLSGAVTKGVAHLTFKSAFGDGKGSATLTPKGDQLEWKIVQSTGAHYLPATSLLTRSKDAARVNSVPEATLSPNRQLGVTVPFFRMDGDYALGEPRNRLVETGTGRILAALEQGIGGPGFNRPLNGHEYLPARWSPDGSLLIWQVNGKWAPETLDVVRLAKGKVLWQLDLLREAQRAILSRTKKAAPERYAAARKVNAGNGVAYPDGFLVTVTTEGEQIKKAALPLGVHVELTANPKGVDAFPADLDSHLDGTVNEAGRFTVAKFAVSPAKR